jgi:hypothetical protein
MYTDTKTHPTVCHGYNLDNGNARSEVAAAGGNFDSIMAGQCTTESVCTKLFDRYLEQSRRDAKRIFGDLSCSTAMAIATDMTYNMGPGADGVGGFHNMIAAMKRSDWDTAAAEARSSAWCGQVGGRCDRNVNQLKWCCPKKNSGGSTPVPAPAVQPSPAPQPKPQPPAAKPSPGGSGVPMPIIYD